MMKMTLQGRLTLLIMWLAVELQDLSLSHQQRIYMRFQPYQLKAALVKLQILNPKARFKAEEQFRI
jgi:hypothetical protein